MKSGPQRFPGASTAYWYGSTYPGSAMEVNVVCWHSTEGTSLPSYDGGSMAPNFTAKPDFAAKRLVWYQHFDFDVSSRALRNLSGGVETNTLNVCQVEIVGTCDPATHTKWSQAGIRHLYTAELPDWAIRDLAAFAKWANANHNVPLSSGLTFKAYPSSYGGNGVRMTGSQWNNFTGHCGHQHVPENDHGDPGAFPMAAILAAAKNGTSPTQEDDMALTNADADVVVDRLLAADKFDAPADASDYSDDPKDQGHYWSGRTVFRDLVTRVRNLTKSTDSLHAKLDALPAVEMTDANIATLASAVASNPALAEQIAEKVAVKLAERLAD
ncbi:hypothetical protein M2164_005977 [Streptomyces sp. SAI-208]|uniref:hypothetical protein n=1 Tax=Streptomyces sp. SAI-208 TaxID=2940550 RepID=UPI00247395B3|nr:hypothetical protein [Streptomyces sp. SAI-208]MDH6610342.1 hypothetical protein [Streptomyces sp. SAI-208]